MSLPVAQEESYVLGDSLPNHFFASPKPLQRGADLAGAFTSLEAESIRQALFATIDAFRLVANQTPGCLGLDYPETADRRATVWARTWA